MNPLAGSAACGGYNDVTLGERMRRSPRSSAPMWTVRGTWSRRARNRVQERRPRCYDSRRQREELAQQFFAAAVQGDLRAPVAILAQDVALYADGGGNVPALAVNGRERVART